MIETRTETVLPVSDADVHAAWDELYRQKPEFAHIPIKAPDPRDWLDEHTLLGLRRALENDRKRVAIAMRDR